jgi:hypothetical protein
MELLGGGVQEVQLAALHIEVHLPDARTRTGDGNRRLSLGWKR